ncbi:MAG TPA: DegT/DnrJ/EryC1/StrS family aminotransferase [Bacteroidia bacterium]|jgi:dTDP-4-amino-4,6-dideoxygalactose transaminase|nr:DegT/DnrJ/EryC1/StrS family aminotransferase [Bacteroidia bacterium]
MTVPFLDLKKQYLSLKPALDKAWEDVVSQSAFIKGKYVSGFEKSFATEINAKHCVSVANGTDAIYIILKMLGIGQGDEVITVANTWISSAETISQTGAKPVFTDIEQDYYCIDTEKIKDKITTKTKAIIAVHLYGQAANISSLQEICKKKNLFLIEDCAQSHLTKYNNQFVGTFGVASTFSFYPGKNLGAYGDAGAIITNDDELAKKTRMYANHGSLVKHQHEIEGINSRLDGLQAAILSVKLPHLQNWNDKRRENTALYNQLLSSIKEIVCPAERKNTNHTYHLYVIRAKKRDALKEYLLKKGIETQIHYPKPLPFVKAYAYLNLPENECPVAAAYMHEILSLPMYPELEKEEIEYVANAIKSFYTEA